jgi:hypothetical protein
VLWEKLHSRFMGSFLCSGQMVPAIELWNLARWTRLETCPVVLGFVVDYAIMRKTFLVLYRLICHSFFRVVHNRTSRHMK